MKLIINTASTLKGGGLQVANSFIEDCRKHPEHEYHVILGFTLAKSIKQDLFPPNFFFYTIAYRPATRVFSVRSHDKFFKEIEQRVQPDIVFTTTGPAYWRPKVPHIIGYNLPHHVYPESPYLKRVSLYRKLRWKLKRLIVWYFFRRDADYIVVQTDDVNKRLREFLNRQNIITVSNTFSSYFNNPSNYAAKLPARIADEFRFLTLTAWYPHKNLSIIPSVVNLLKGRLSQKIKFVLTLPQEIFDKEIPEFYKDDIINVGPVSIKEAPSLYTECDAMFLPTLLECFSASYAEAMVMKKPILTSDMGFAHTVCGSAALYFNPIDAEDIAEKVITLIVDSTLRRELIMKGEKQLGSYGSSEKRTSEYLSICQRALDERKN